MKSRFFTLIKPALLGLMLFFYSVVGNGQSRIVCIGNSITQGNQNTYSYRYFLWKKLLDIDADFKFVGSLNQNNNGNPEWPAYAGKTFDSAHEGRWGWSTKQALYGHEDNKEEGTLDQWLQGYVPDIVLLHFGTNDMFRNHSIPATLDNLREIIAKVRGRNARAVILLAQLIPANPETVGPQQAENIVNLNKEIPALAAELNTADSPVVLVDQHSGFDPTPGKDTYDGVHPNASGEEKMAEKWLQVVRQFVKIKSVTQTGKDILTETGMLLYPTVASQQQITIELQDLTPNELLRLEIYSKEGKLLQQLNEKVNQTGTFTKRLQLSNKYASGIYFMRIVSADRVQTREFIIAQ
ncbi:GDSL-type esterase/lipase family protein [Pontibacter sp. SGAir0037]|uniref:GDSL-type esterase/lipase family protein n=1 Tax=Pontibacter sp. SGAir0037 TaxID=2571030 RepID=UPI0010CD0AFE|nr:GDSL-type esterase/lipase family protein [Pontibacter sp. SGAir0037]QCR23602.1 hypothetical protein C1N53_15450 [Pontibacter sp. SGAir0037]